MTAQMPDLFGEPVAAPVEGGEGGELGAWLGTHLGQHTYDVMRWRAIALVRAGVTDLTVASLRDWIRRTRALTLTDRWDAELATRLTLQHAELRGKLA